MSTSPTSPISFTGVSTYSSDLQSILTRQAAIAQLPITLLQDEQSTNTSKLQALGTLNTAVASLGSSIAALGSIGSNKGLVASSSDASITATNTGATSPTTYTISNVTSLAMKASGTSLQGYANSTTTTVPSSLQLVVGSTSYSITLATGKNNLAGLQNAINSSGAPVTASILTTGSGANPNYLVVSANNSGATTLQLNDITNPASPVALLNGAQAISENSAQTYADPANTSVSSNNSLQLVLGSNTYNITLASGENNLNGLVSELNNIAGNPVTASVSTSNGQSSLVVAANQIGAATMQLNDIPASGASTNLLSSVNNNATQGSNAVFELNGLPINETTNFINNVIPGVTFNLVSQPSSPVTISLSSDTTSLSNALNDLMTNYNAVVDQVDAQVGPSAGPLSGDLAVRTVMDDMRQLTTYQVPGSNKMSLATMGITFDYTGKMSFDPTALTGLTSSQLSDAFTYLGSSTTGFGAVASQFTQLSDPITGLIQNEESGANTTNTDLTNQINTLTDRLNTMQTALSSQLEKADAAIAALQSQQQVISSSVQSVDLALYGQNFGAVVTPGG